MATTPPRRPDYIFTVGYLEDERQRNQRREKNGNATRDV
jgi:hypothetical protein